MKEFVLDILSGDEINYLKTDISNLVNDPSLRRRLVLGKKTSGTYDPTTGVTGVSWTRDAIYGVRGVFDTKSNIMGYGGVELGDVYFLVKKDDYIDELGVELDTGDQVLELKYEVGTIDVTLSSTAVTGHGTSWLLNAGPFDALTVLYENTYYEVASVGSTTGITLRTNYLGATKTYQYYQLFTQWQIMSVTQSALDIARRLHCRRVK